MALPNLKNNIENKENCSFQIINEGKSAFFISKVFVSFICALILVNEKLICLQMSI